MIAVDTNLLVHAHRADTASHESARRALEQLAGMPGGWAIPWPCVHEFLAVVTGPAFRDARTPLQVALEALAAWTAHPRCMLLGESGRHLDLLAALTLRASVSGGAVHDARIAAICLGHGVEELWTSDRDFARFPDLRTRNPLIPSLHEPAPLPVRHRAPAARKRSGGMRG